jgi:hypothetical protein
VLRRTHSPLRPGAPQVPHRLGEHMLFPYVPIIRLFVKSVWAFVMRAFVCGYFVMRAFVYASCDVDAGFSL